MSTENTTKTNTKVELITRVNKAVEAYLLSEGELFRGRTQDCLDESDVVSFVLQTVKQRLTQRRKGKADRDFMKTLKETHPEVMLALKKHRTAI